MDKNTFTSNTIVDSNNIDKIIDYLNGILEEDKKVQSYVVDGKLCIVLDDGQGIVVDDKTTMGDVIYAFSDYLKFDDSVKEDNEKIKKDYGGDQKSEGRGHEDDLEDRICCDRGIYVLEYRHPDLIEEPYYPCVVYGMVIRISACDYLVDLVHAVRTDLSRI